MMRFWLMLMSVTLSATSVARGQEAAPSGMPLTQSPSNASTQTLPPLIYTQTDEPLRPIPVPQALDPNPQPQQPPASTFDGFGGRGGMGGMGGGMGGGGMNGGPGYSATWNPNRPVTGTNDSIWIVRQSLNAGVPVYREGPDMLIVTTTIRNTQLRTTAVLPDSKQLFPNDLWTINFGLLGTHKFDNGWTFMGMTSFGSSSDQPFASIHEMNISLLGSLMVPVRNDRDSWMFSIFYNPASSLNFPVPGVAYVWNPNETLRINIGIPFSIFWKPTEDLTINANYIPLTNITARATYRITPNVFTYIGYEFLNEAYFLRDRIEQKDRFMSFEQRVVGGFRYNVLPMLALETQAGYAFGRYFAEGVNQGGSQTDRVDVAPGAFLGLSLRGRF